MKPENSLFGRFKRGQSSVAMEVDDLFLRGRGGGGSDGNGGMNDSLGGVHEQRFDEW